MSSSIKGTERKEKILECAKNLFAQKGYDGVSTRLLANESGTNLAMISYYFGSKEEMYKEILEKDLIKLKSDVEILHNPEATNWDKLFAIIDVYVERCFTNKQMVQIVFKEISTNKREGLSKFVGDKMLENFTVIEDIIENGVKKKTFKKTDVGLLIMSIFGTLMLYINANKSGYALLGAKNNKEYMSDEYKLRVKNHLKNLLKNQLAK